jgi:hypothetical protein
MTHRIIARILFPALAAWFALSMPASGDSASDGWRIEERSEDRATLAILPARQALLFAGQPVEPRLVVACVAGETDLWLDFGRPVHPADAPLRVNLRLDRGRPTQATWNVGADQRRAHMVEQRLDSALRVSGRDSALASRDASELARSLAGHDRLAVRSATAYGGHVALSFDLAGLDDALREVADRCGWSESAKAALH